MVDLSTSPHVSAALLEFVQRCAADNPAAIGKARNEAVELLEVLGIAPREPGLIYHDDYLADLRAAIAAQQADAELVANAESPYEIDARRALISVRWPQGGWILWNWRTHAWDHVAEHPHGKVWER